MAPAINFLSRALAVFLLSVQLAQVSSLGFPGFSWGWGTGAENLNYTKVITSPEVLHRHPLHYPFKQCSAGMEGVMTRLLLFPCIGDRGRCQLIRGENVTLDLEFISNIPATSLEGSLSAVFTRWFSPLTLGEPQDLCTSEHITCPIQPFHPYRYRTSIFVRPTLPSLSPDIRVIIKAENEREIACAIVPVAIMGLESETSRDTRGSHTTTLAI